MSQEEKPCWTLNVDLTIMGLGDSQIRITGKVNMAVDLAQMIEKALAVAQAAGELQK